jgi:hypothetical protein
MALNEERRSFERLNAVMSRLRTRKNLINRV